MSLRALPIRVRFVLAVAVPTLALLAAVGYEAQARQEVAAAARSELDRTRALETLAGLQAMNVVPDVAAVDGRIAAAEDPSLVPLAMADYWEVTAAQFRQADDARGALSPAARATIGEAGAAAFDRQRAAADAILAAVEAGRPVDPALVEEAEVARREADVAFADLALASASDAWIVYIGAIDAIRAGRNEYSHLMPVLLGLPTTSAAELAGLAGVRANATERVILALGPELRGEVETVLASDLNQRWGEAVAQGQAISAGQAEPWSVFDLAELSGGAQQLEEAIWVISAQAIGQVRADLTATADTADRQRHQLLVFGGSLLAVTVVLTGWILHSITWPLHRLTRRVAAVAAGDLDGERFDLGGNDELTRLGTTIEDMAAGLRHLDRQIQAMTEGALDDPSLDRPVPGPVGIYVQQRVQQLRKVSGDWQNDAERDPLTGTLNRRGLRDAMARIPLPSPAPLALVYLDLDRFKAVNDEYGHRHGDAVLQVVAARLAGFVRPDDLVARLGGDEFALVVGGVEAEMMPVFTSRLELGVSEPIAFEGQVHQVGCSIGVSWLGDDDDFDAVVEQADHAMLAVKAARPHHPAR